MRITDEQIVAFVDGELADEKAGEIAALAKADPALAQRIARYEQTRSILKAAYAPIEAQPIPDPLIQHVTRQDRTNRKYERKRRPKSPSAWNAVKEQIRDLLCPAGLKGATAAAILLVSLIVGRQLLIPDGAGYLATERGMILAQGELARVLDEDLSGRAGRDRQFDINFSVPAEDGIICRVFEYSDEKNMTSIACRAAGAWQIVALTAAQAFDSEARGEYRPAGGERLPPAIQTMVETLKAGDPLGKEDEADARARGWRRGR